MATNEKPTNKEIHDKHCLTKCSHISEYKCEQCGENMCCTGELWEIYHRETGECRKHNVLMYFEILEYVSNDRDACATAYQCLEGCRVDFHSLASRCLSKKDHINMLDRSLKKYIRCIYCLNRTD